MLLHLTYVLLYGAYNSYSKQIEQKLSNLSWNPMILSDFLCLKNHFKSALNAIKKVQVGKDQEKAQSEKDSHSKNQSGKILN